MAMLRFSINKVPFTASLVAIWTLSLTGFVTLKPNRLLDGQGVNLFEVSLAGGTMVAAVLAAILPTSVVSVPPGFRLAASGFLPALLIPFMLLVVGRHATIIFETTGPIARVSVGTALWACIFALSIIVLDTYQADSANRLPMAAMGILSGAALVLLLVYGQLDNLSIMREFANRRERFTDELLTHLALAGASVTAAMCIGIPMGILAHRRMRLRGPAFFTLNTLQTVPSLALFGILIPVLAAVTSKVPALEKAGVQAIGAAPAIIALVIYSLLPVARNTFSGFQAVDLATIDAGRGMGMTNRQLLFRVELPIASPIILNGVRVAIVQAIGLTAVAALIGAGGFGVFIFQGLGQAATDLILLGAIPTILVAVAADSAMHGLITLVQPKGL
jgi:osmoprotectant transport system permease protein